MEIIGEILFEILGWIFQFLGELILQMIVEAVAELVGHSIKEPFRRPESVHPWLAAIGYFIFGGIAGGLSLLLFPNLFIETKWLRVANIALSPLAAGLIMSLVGSWRRKHEKELIRLDSFAYGFCFALSMSFVRFIWGH
jgi:hypothetical protein